MPIPTYSDFKRYEKDADDAANQLGLDPAGAHNGEWDAFRHAYASAEMTREYGEDWARLLGDANEFIHPDGFFNGEANMDLWNNAKGREIGKVSTSKEDTIRRVKETLDQGDLLVIPSDPRFRYGYDYDDTYPIGFYIDAIRDQCAYASTTCTPIILDLDGDGVETIPLAGNVYFDHAGDGFAEQTGWVSAEDGLLVRDLNNNGTIDTGAELFGNNTVLTSGRLAATGFAALAELDADKNGRIDAADPAFAGLRIWKDANANGRTDNGELHSLAELGIASISTAFTASVDVDENNNTHRQIGSYTTADGTTRAAEDVFFNIDPLYSIATQWLDVPEDIQALPDISGYGKMRSLHQAMVRDAEIRTLHA